MNINNLGLLNSLSSILNEGIKDSDYAIAVYLVENINRTSEISVNEIIDETFTSRSAVRRFL
jgi:DNA-binding MurR/RpiR family transcriptional regulator